MNKIKAAIYAIVLLSLHGQAFSQTKVDQVISNVSVAEFRDVIDSLHNEVLIDLRTPEELEKGKIPGAIVIDFFGADFEPSIQALDRNKVYLLYCASGGRSGETADLMIKLGFKKVYNLEQGFNGWLKQKMPTTTK